MGVVSGGGSGGSQPSAATVRLSGTASGLTNGQTIPWDTVLLDAGGYFSAVTHQFTIPAGKGGTFLVGQTLNCGSVTAGAPVVISDVSNSGNDVNIVGAAPRRASDSSAQAVACLLVQLAAGDVLTPAALFDGGGTIDVFANTSAFWLVKVT